MIRWSSKKPDGTLLIGLGVEEENIKRLVAGKPIVVDGKPLGFDGKIFIHYGTDKAALVRQLTDAGIHLPDVVKMDLKGKPHAE